VVAGETFRKEKLSSEEIKYISRKQKWFNDHVTLIEDDVDNRYSKKSY
jgi:hypothetical protein